MPTFIEKYTQPQRDAMAHAYEDRRIRPASRVVELAANGELTHQGAQLDAFECNANTVRSEARDLRKRRAGQKTSKLSEVPHRDAVETLRRRFINVADAVLQELEKQKASLVDVERLRQVGRVLREAQALPDRTEPRQPAPGQKVDGVQHGGQTRPGRQGLAGTIIAAHRATQAEGEPAPEASHDLDGDDARALGGDDGEHHAGQAAHNHDDPGDDAPGSHVRKLAATAGVELDGLEVG